MAQPLPPPSLLSVDEYLALESDSAVRHEYVAGHVYAMTGASRRHNRLALRVAGILERAARGGPCRVYMEGVRLRVGRDVFYYPDVMVACGAEPADTHEERASCLLVEVLSPSTHAIDRREKVFLYRQIDSLLAYLVVHQDRRRVERHWRDAEGRWQYADVSGAGGAWRVPVPCPDGELTLDEIYEGVTLDPPAAAATDAE